MSGFSLSAETVLLCWIGFWSITAAALAVSDKLRARRHAWRIPEKVLFLVSALGGSAAMLLFLLPSPETEMR